MKLTSREVLYHYQLKDLVSMENQIENAIESLAEAATNEQLKEAFNEHHTQTQEQLKKVQKLLEATGKSARGRKCKGIESILTEGAEAANSTGDDTDAKDAALIAAARSVEHYETAAYIAACDSARALGLDEDARMLQSIMQEEAEADRKLASISSQINPSSADQDSAEGSAQSSDSPVLERSSAMNTQYTQQQGNYQGQGSYEDRAEGGRHSAQMQNRDEQGRFTGYQDQNYGPYQGQQQGQYQGQYQDQYGQGNYAQGNQGGYNDYNQGGYQSGYNQGGYNQGQSIGGQHSTQMQNRDEQGRFIGHQSAQDYPTNYSNQGGNQGGYQGGGYNQGGYQGQGGYTDSAGRHYTQQSWEAAQQGRSLGGQHSRANQYANPNPYGNQGAQYGNQYGNQGNYGNQGGNYDNRGGQRDIVDSAGRHYTQESWEAAQRGRSLGGQHSHGGGGNYGNQGGSNR